VSSEIFIGLMSGTSLDAIDAVIVELRNNSVKLLHSSEYRFPEKLRHQLANLIEHPETVSLDHLGTAHRALGIAYADAVMQLLSAAKLQPDEIVAIGCHGQTVRHQPDSNPAFTFQIGDAATLATATGITVVNDFRSADIALGGQGAPLVPAFHRYAFADSARDRIVVNIGGIANITVLKRGSDTAGFDTGPGNTLLDHWAEKNLGKRYDDNGAWAREGNVIEPLLDAMLADHYFSLEPPKSTGREYFNAAWLQRHLQATDAAHKAIDVQATLAELTTRSVAIAILRVAPDADVYLCGGGAKNGHLAERLAANLERQRVATTEELGVGPDWVEACAFAWLARARLQHACGNVPAVTGAARPAILGAITAP